MGDPKEYESIAGLIKEASKNVEEKKKKEGKKTALADTVNKTAKAIDVWTPTNVFRFGLAGLLTVVKLGLTSSAALAATPWWLVLLPAYILEGFLIVALLSFGLLAVLYFVVMALWAAVEILVIEPIQRRRLKKKIDDATHTGAPAEDMLAGIHRSIMAQDGEQSH